MNKKLKLISIVVVKAISIAVLIYIYEGQSAAWYALLAGIAVTAWQVQLGIFRKPVLAGYTLVKYSNENNATYQFARLFSAILWVAVLVAAIKYDG